MTGVGEPAAVHLLIRDFPDGQIVMIVQKTAYTAFLAFCNWWMPAGTAGRGSTRYNDFYGIFLTRRRKAFRESV
jgi:hypothetical protein